jgi:outer membrane protein
MAQTGVWKEFIVKKWLYAAGLGLVMASSASVQAADKIAIVNVASIFQQMPAREAVAKQLENEFKSRATDLQSQERDLQTKMQRLQRDGSTMKASDRSKLEKDVMAQREAFSTKAQQFEQDNRRRQAEERNKILSRIQDAVKSVASKEGYDVVIDANAIAYANNDKDITADVLKQVK